MKFFAIEKINHSDEKSEVTIKHSVENSTGVYGAEKIEGNTFVLNKDNNVAFVTNEKLLFQFVWANGKLYTKWFRKG